VKILLALQVSRFLNSMKTANVFKKNAILPVISILSLTGNLVNARKNNNVISDVVQISVLTQTTSVNALNLDKSVTLKTKDNVKNSQLA